MKISISLMSWVACVLALMAGPVAYSSPVTSPIAGKPLVEASAQRSAPRQEVLPSWLDNETRRRIIAFVESTTREGAPGFVPVSERIAVFDNDGTLWSEQPIYVQLAFVLDRIRALVPSHPEWSNQALFQAALNGDTKTLFSFGEKGLLTLLLATHAGMSSTDFEAEVSRWITVARHPKTGRLYTEMVYQPMQELISYLHAKDYKVFIVSGGGAEFMRPWSEKVYGIARDRVIGSTLKNRYEIIDGKPQITRLPEIEFINDKAGKPVGIARHIGRRPVFAVGNSDGDLEMLQWTTSGQGPRFALLLHHTDSERETAYDRESAVGRLDKALDLAPKAGWQVIDMKQDWRTVFPAP